VLQWSHNPSRTVSFQLQWSALEALRRQRQTTVETDRYLVEQGRQAFLYRDFLHALVLPIERGRAPSRVTLIWPQFMMLTGVVTKIGFNFNRFGQNGAPISFDASLELLELRTTFMQRTGNRFPFVGDRQGSLERFRYDGGQENPELGDY
jgi:hypothetical protein